MDDNYSESLLTKLLNDQLTEDQFAELNQRMLESSELRRKYIRLKELDSLLATESLSVPPPCDSSETVNLQSNENNRCFQSQGYGGNRSGGNRSEGKRKGWWLLAISTAAVAVLAITWSTLLKKQTPIYRPMGLQGLSSIAVVKAAGDQLLSDGTLAVGMDLKPGSIVLPHGTLTIVFNVGAEVVITGPAELHLLNDQEATLLYGEARVDMQHENGRFALNSPFSSHVETYSSYALSVSAEASLVTVFDGELVVSRLGDKGYTYTSVTLKSKQRLRASADSLEMLEPAPRLPDNYSLSRAPEAAALQVTELYAQAIIEDMPKLYWRFEGDQSTALSNTMGDEQLAARIVSSDPTAAPQLTGNSLLFEISEQPRLVQLERSIDNFLNGNFSVELLVKPTRGRWQSIISLIPEKSASDVDHHLLMEFADESHMVQPRNSFRFLYRNPAGKVHGVNLFSRGGQSVGAWHHLVATKDNDLIRFYHNGTLVGGSGISPQPNHDRLLLYLGQLRLHNNERAFCGEMDDLAIYDYTLSFTQIQEHFRLLKTKEESSRFQNSVL